MLVSSLIATKKRTDIIRSNLHAGQYDCWQRFLKSQPGTGAGGATGVPWGHHHAFLSPICYVCAGLTSSLAYIS